MSYNPDLLVPWGYGQDHKRLSDVRATLLVHYHPEYLRRLLAWLTYKNGVIGIGGSWRALGAQPDKSGFAPEGRSFHQNQTFRDKFVGACAVDLVSRDGPDKNFSHDGIRWEMVPAQGSTEARRWGLHCNISSEAWHMQPIEIDGWEGWRDAGRVAPAADYPLPGESTIGKPPPILISQAPPATPFPLRRIDLDKSIPTDPARTRWLQQICNERFGGQLTVDGGFGAATHAAVMVMQRILDAQPNVQVSVDGVYGSQTAAALAAWLARH